MKTAVWHITTHFLVNGHKLEWHIWIGVVTATDIVDQTGSINQTDIVDQTSSINQTDIVDQSGTVH